VRWLMLAVAIVGVLLGMIDLRARRFQVIADHYRAEADRSDTPNECPSLRHIIYSRWSSEYEKAARHPWAASTFRMSLLIEKSPF
jgi:hypothetical protein